MLGPILFNFYINDLFLFIKQATLYNYADDNTLAYFCKSMPDLINIMEKETGVALNWLKQNEMIANPEKFHVLLLRKNQTNTSGEQININGKIIQSQLKTLVKKAAKLSKGSQRCRPLITDDLDKVRHVTAKVHTCCCVRVCSCQWHNGFLYQRGRFRRNFGTFRGG